MQAPFVYLIFSSECSTLPKSNYLDRLDFEHFLPFYIILSGAKMVEKSNKIYIYIAWPENIQKTANAHILQDLLPQSMKAKTILHWNYYFFTIQNAEKLSKSCGIKLIHIQITVSHLNCWWLGKNIAVVKYSNLRCLKCNVFVNCNW